MKVENSVWDMLSLRFPLESLPFQLAGGDGEQAAGYSSLASDLGALRTEMGFRAKKPDRSTWE